MKNSPMRKCVGCNQSKNQEDLYRIALYNGKLTFDKDGRANGRGVYICKDRECILNAKKNKALCRGFRSNLDDGQVEKIFQELMDEQGM